MKNCLTIIKKELRRFFTDKRMVASIILPGLLIFVMYSIMGSVFSNIGSVSNDYTYKVYAINEPETFSPLFKDLNIEYLDTEGLDVDLMKDAVRKEDADLLIIYSGDFSNLNPSNETKPQIEMYYNSVRTESAAIFQTIQVLLNAYQNQLVGQVFYINNGIDFDLASDKEKSSSYIAMLLPFLLLIFMFSGVMAVVPESIAGEKERGTIATLLVTPLRRTDLAIGKIISLSIISLLSALSSFIGTMLSLPKLMQLQESTGLTNLYYSALDFIYIVLILCGVILLFVGLLSIVSAFSKSVKEATSYATPVMIVVMVVGIFSMFGNVSSNPFVYFIPVYNAVIALSAILSFEASTLTILITIISNVVYALLCGIILSKMFNNEKIMFSK